MTQLAEYLRRWDRRRRAAQSLAWGVRGLSAGLAVGVLIALAARVWPLLAPTWLMAIGGLWAVMGLAAALILVWAWPISALEQARLFDHRLGLKERASTAVEIQQGRINLPEGWAQAQLQNALQAAEAAEATAAIPLQLPRRDGLLAALAAALLVAAIWLPNPMQAQLADRAAVREAIEAQIEEIEALREEISADDQLSEADRETLLRILDGAVEQLRAGDLTREEALAELNATADRLRELTSDTTGQQAAGLQAAAAALQNNALTSPLAEALLNGDFQQAAALLESLSTELGEQLTREQELELAGELAAAAAELAGSNPDLAEQLAQAAQNIQSGDMAAAQQALAQASQTMSQTGQMIAAAQAAQQAAGQLAQSGQQIAQAGSGPGNQGQQPGAGGNQGNQGQQPGAGGSGAGSGEGSGEGAGGQARPMQAGNQPGDGGLSQYESIYAPQRLGGEGGPEMELEQGNDPGELVRLLPSNPETGRSTVPYRQVFAQYRDAANQALDQQHIPLGLRSYVRDYFSSLEPSEESR